LRGLFVTGTDTGAGKTVLAGAIVAALAARGERVRPLKPVLTGLEEPRDPDWPPDHELLAAAAGVPADTVALRRYDPPVSPHLAASLSGRPLRVAELVEEVRAAGAEGETLVVEGVGGLLVPLGEGWDVLRFAAAVGLPVVVAARPGLGTINHTLLTLQAARAAGLRVLCVVLTPWPAQPDVIEASNRETIASLGQVAVATLPSIASAEAEALARAGAGLPLEDWLTLPG
jgi:dethiobiotin synthetase